MIQCVTCLRTYTKGGERDRNSSVSASPWGRVKSRSTFWLRSLCTLNVTLAPRCVVVGSALFRVGIGWKTRERGGARLSLWCCGSLKCTFQGVGLGLIGATGRSFWLRSGSKQRTLCLFVGLW